ncbi:MAG: MBL fold metallo-hydrolase, partial [Spirochaetales bacterium]|nr:MBL fold metallo-hydrolase [Spirochaetales bacterium]
HYDHASLLPAIRAAYDPVVYAYSSSLEGVDRILNGGEMLKLGDRTFEVIHIPGHSSDSVCLYCEQDEVLFSGDSSVFIGSADETYEQGFTDALERICSKNIRTVYPGHGRPIAEGCPELLAASLRNVRGAKSTAARRRATA